MAALLPRAVWLGACLLGGVYGCGGDSRSDDDADAGESGSSTAGDGGRAATGGRGGAGVAGASGAAGRGAGTGSGGSTSAGESGTAGVVAGTGGDPAGGGDGGAGESASGGVSSSGASGGNTGGASGTGGIPNDECHDDDDCPPIVCVTEPCPQSVCVLGSEGYRICAQRSAAPPAGNCDDAPETCCTSSADCEDAAGGECVPFSFGYCGGPAPPEYSTCRYDACARDADCTDEDHGVCLLDYPRRCFYGPCSSSADCQAGLGGRCVVGSSGQSCAALQVFCRYDDDPCQSANDCPSQSGMPQVCAPDPDGHGRHCEPWQPPPP